MSITQRANELYCDKDGYVKDLADDFMRLGYIKGAEEQRDIERKKFYKAYCSLCPCYMDGCAGECDKLKYIKHIIEHED